MSYTAPKMSVVTDLLKDGEGTALTEMPDARWSYSVLKSAVEALQKDLTNGGLAKGDVVSIVLGNSIEYVCCFLATIGLGAIAAPLNATYTEEEFKFYLDDAKVAVVIVTADGNPVNATKAGEALGTPVWKTGLEGSSVVLNTGDRKLPGGPVGATSEDVALFLHTSGTTSKPKGVPLTHKNLCTSIGNIAGTYQLVESDVSLLVMPLFHVHGLMGVLLSTLATGGEVVIPKGGKFSASSFWDTVKARNVNWYSAVPTIHQILLARADKDFPNTEEKPPKLRFIRSCSSALAPVTLHSLETQFGAKVLEAYAMTEAAHQMCSNPLVGERRPGTVGKGTNVNVAILSDNNEILPPNAVGEVCIQGENVTPGYLNNPNANQVAFAGGWFHTGDQGMLSEDGYLQLTGRIKELINRGGEKISPLEVDAALLTHPAVDQAVSFAAPDEKYGEEVNAAIVLLPDVPPPSEEDIKEYCKDRLASFKIPKRIFFDTWLPKTATGKIQRRIVSAHFLSKD